MNYPYRRQNPYLGACFFFLSKKKLIEMAVMDGMALNLESEDQRQRAEERGQEVLQQWEDKYRTDYTKMTNKINSALWSAFWVMIFAIALSLAVAAYHGSVGFSLSFDLAKFITFIGSALVGWATLMELGGNIPVWDGNSFPQLAHTVIFKAIFVPGVLFVLTSILA